MLYPLFFLHNHPSGDPTPSKEDLLTTRRIREAGALIGIELLDHIIIGDNCYFSLRRKDSFLKNLQIDKGMECIYGQECIWVRSWNL